MLKNNKGFTLIEGIVAGIVGVIIAGIVVVFLNIHNKAVKEGTAKSLVQMQAEVITKQISRNIRSANVVLGPGETWSPKPKFTTRDTTIIILYDNAGAVFAAYRIEGGVLKESKDGTAYTDFKAGTEKVKMDKGSNFALSANRKEVTLNLRVAVNYKGVDYKSNIVGGMYQCRN
jgi:type II secretory pathway pseudopilin PulG